MFPGLDLSVINRSCTTSHNGRRGGGWSRSWVVRGVLNIPNPWGLCTGLSLAATLSKSVAGWGTAVEVRSFSQPRSYTTSSTPLLTRATVPYGTRGSTCLPDGPPYVRNSQVSLKSHPCIRYIPTRHSSRPSHWSSGWAYVFPKNQFSVRYGTEPQSRFGDKVLGIRVPWSPKRECGSES